MGYHLREIKKGVLGESSKIAEELEELFDAEEQDAKLMALCELADLYGAINAYIDKHHPTITMADLAKMDALTRRAFKEGRRK